MPWKQGYTISDERSLTDSELRWPDGARCCVAMTVDLSVASGPEGVTAADLSTPEALFGANQGLAALREVLRRHAMRATFAVPAIIAHIHRDLVRSLTAEGHEIAAHGFRHEDVSGLERDEERQRIARATEILADVTGHRQDGFHCRGRATATRSARSAPTRSICCSRRGTCISATDWPTTFRIIG
jgi:peptidoglycan-N-acetylglucosamine deacetylase